MPVGRDMRAEGREGVYRGAHCATRARRAVHQQVVLRDVRGTDGGEGARTGAKETRKVGCEIKEIAE